MICKVRWPIGVMVLLALTAGVPARTITVTGEDCDEMAAISVEAPRLSWVMAPYPGMPMTHPTLFWSGSISLLMRYPVKDLIPKGQRVTKAELTIAPYYLAGTPEIHVRRILAEWGTGVCHQYRMTHPQKLAWAQPGCSGGATDRVAKDSAVFKFAKIGAQTVDLTEDVELWYTGAVANRGWIFTLEPNGHHCYVTSPYAPHYQGGKEWKLQITYEPK
jgi:hypothetical protein